MILNVGASAKGALSVLLTLKSLPSCFVCDGNTGWGVLVFFSAPSTVLFSLSDFVLSGGNSRTGFLTPPSLSSFAGWFCSGWLSLSAFADLTNKTGHVSVDGEVCVSVVIIVPLAELTPSHKLSTGVLTLSLVSD